MKLHSRIPILVSILTMWFIAAPVLASDSNEYNQGLNALEQGNLKQAIDNWQTFVNDHPTDTKTPTIKNYLTLLIREQTRQDAQKAISREQHLTSGPFDDKTIAIMPFETIKAKYNFGKAIALMTISDLSQIPGLKLVERQRIQALISEMKLTRAGLTDIRAAGRTGRLLGAGIVITGTVFEEGKPTGKYQITTSMAKTRTVKQIGFQEAIGIRKDWFKLQKEIVYEILRDLNISPIPDNVRKYHTKNWKAYVEFTRGLELQDQGQFTEARQAFKNALANDTGFDLARKVLEQTPSASMTASQIVSKIKNPSTKYDFYNNRNRECP